MCFVSLDLNNLSHYWFRVNCSFGHTNLEHHVWLDVYVNVQDGSQNRKLNPMAIEVELLF